MPAPEDSPAKADNARARPDRTTAARGASTLSPILQIAALAGRFAAPDKFAMRGLAFVLSVRPVMSLVQVAAMAPVAARATAAVDLERVVETKGQAALLS